MLGKQHSFRRKFSFPERYPTCHGQNQRSKIGAAYAEYEMLPSCEAPFNHSNLNGSWLDNEPINNYNSHNKHTLYKKAASSFSLQKYGNEGGSYIESPSCDTFGGGIVYDTDVKYHYDRIVVIPGNDKWRNSSNYSKSTMSTNSSDTSYSIPKPLPRRDSLRGRTKSVFNSKPSNSFDAQNTTSNYTNGHVENNVAPNNGDLGSLSYNRALSAPPASPRHACNPNRFTWWFGSSSASEPNPKPILTNKLYRYVNIQYIKRQKI